MPFDLDFLSWLVVLIPLFYLGVPLVTRFHTKMAANPDLKLMDLDELAPDIADYLEEQSQSLASLGFVKSAVVRMAGATNVTTYLVMAINRTAGDKAMATVMFGHTAIASREDAPPPWRRDSLGQRRAYLEFSTRLATGEVFDTLNSPMLGSFRKKPGDFRTHVPMVADPSELYRLHLCVMRKHGATSPRIVYEPGKALDYLVDVAINQSCEEQVAFGRMFHDETTDAYRPTIKGAYLMTWGMMHPFLFFRQIAMRRRARRILAELHQAEGTSPQTS